LYQITRHIDTFRITAQTLPPEVTDSRRAGGLNCSTYRRLRDFIAQPV